jgi:hypothetical protein
MEEKKNLHKVEQKLYMGQIKNLMVHVGLVCVASKRFLRVFTFYVQNTETITNYFDGRHCRRNNF